ncbi:MAG TPA: hypothetical protein VMV69_07815 [Pirellulales bacterium]|nr:hypothetical protein [Pirellulales bacterium]
MLNFFTRASSRLARSAFDVSRYRGVIVTAAGTLVAFVALHFALGVAFGTGAERLSPNQRPLGLELYINVWSRVAAIDRMHHRGQLAADTRLGVVLGVSSTQAGIQRRILEAAATEANRWVVLTGAGLSFENLASVTRPVFFCSLRPSLVVMCVHPQMLVGEGYFADDETPTMPGVVGRAQRGRRASPWAALGVVRLLRAHWIVKNHVGVGYYLRSLMYELRLWVFRAAGVSAEALFPAAEEPWDDEPLWWWQLDAANEDFAQSQIDFWRKQGHFKAANYDPAGPQARRFVGMIRDYRALGAEVYVVIMPLRSPLRRLVPPQAKPCLKKALRLAFPDAPPPIIDLERAIPDEFFTDEAHLGRSGAERLSTLVADRLEKDAIEKGAMGVRRWALGDGR